ncbi:hypothetical protein SDC9_140342 [bioreactor metagenome]|uniref:Uncharacterized protein n=1 Tax=bioreactor metagenome TaxID=1076179 RepID=A0A645DV24_9ZZZZ
MHDTVDDRVAHVDVRRGHVDARPEHLAAIGELTVFHCLKQPEVFFNRAVAVGTVLPWFLECAAVFLYLFGRQVAHERLALPDELHGIVVEFVEIIRSVIHVIPCKAEPAHVLHDGIDVFDILLGGVCIVKAQITCAVVFEGHAEVDADGLGVPDVQVAVGLGRKPRLQARILLHVLFNILLYEAAVFF